MAIEVEVRGFRGKRLSPFRGGPTSLEVDLVPHYGRRDVDEYPQGRLRDAISADHWQ